jgi:hypothetical protein
MALKGLQNLARPLARKVGLWMLKALLIELTRLFCKQQRTSTSKNAEREAPGEDGLFLTRYLGLKTPD